MQKRLWGLANPRLSDEVKAALAFELMSARRAVKEVRGRCDKNWGILRMLCRGTVACRIGKLLGL